MEFMNAQCCRNCRQYIFSPAGQVAVMGKIRNSYEVLDEEPRGKTPRIWL
jgi:hypothetical protein